MRRSFAAELALSAAKVAIGGLVVGTCHPRPLLLALGMGLFLAVRLHLDLRRGDYRGHEWQVFSGMCVAYLLGYVSEWLGTHHGWWTYRYYETGHRVPPWVPIAWAMAYKILYRLELAQRDRPGHAAADAAALTLVTLVLPPLGEIIAIAFGTWRYAFQPQFLGMPWQAVVLIACVHQLIMIVARNLGRHLPRLAAPPA